MRSRKSLLLLGPRQTGKSTLMGALSPTITINFAHEPTYLDFLRDARLLEARLNALPGRPTVFIDEVQRIPSILNTIQYLLDSPKNRYRFILTGSSARKLKRGNANLLPGRVHVYHLGPLAGEEIPPDADLASLLSTGTLPGIVCDSDLATRQKTLRSYAGTYLKEEIQAENLTRNIEGFARFLAVAAEYSGKHADFAKMASLAQVPRASAMRFFEVLEDSLIAYRVEAFALSSFRRLIQHPRYSFFDVGVLNGLLGNFSVSDDRKGGLFEQFIVGQIRHMAQHLDRDVRLSTYRTEHGAEVDLIVEEKARVSAVEIKCTRTIRSGDLEGLKSFKQYFGKPHRPMVLYAGDHPLKFGPVNVWPWKEGLTHLFLLE